MGLGRVLLRQLSAPFQVIIIIIVIIHVIINRNVKNAQLTRNRHKSARGDSRPKRQRIDKKVLSECLKESSDTDGSHSSGVREFQVAGADE